MAVIGTTGIAPMPRSSPISRAPMKPILSWSCGFGRVTSTSKTRLLASAAGEMRVIGPRNSTPGSASKLSVKGRPTCKRGTMSAGTPNTALSEAVSARVKAPVPVPTRVPTSMDRFSTTASNGALRALSRNAISASSSCALAPSTLAWVPWDCALMRVSLACACACWARAASTLACASSKRAFAVS